RGLRAVEADRLNMNSSLARTGLAHFDIFESQDLWSAVLIHPYTLAQRGSWRMQLVLQLELHARLQPLREVGAIGGRLIFPLPYRDQRSSIELIAWLGIIDSNIDDLPGSRDAKTDIDPAFDALRERILRIRGRDVLNALGR